MAASHRKHNSEKTHCPRGHAYDRVTFDNTAGGIKRWCSECRNASKKKQTYGVTFEQYNEMLERQGGVCAICGEEETRSRKGVIFKLTIDHDHETGRVRGLLCSNCNVGLGMIEDHLEGAVAYLGRLFP